MELGDPNPSPASSPGPPSPSSSPLRSIGSSPVCYDSSPLKGPSSIGSGPPSPARSQASSPIGDSSPLKAPSSIPSVCNESSPFKAPSPASSQASSPICEVLSSPYKGVPSSPLTASEAIVSPYKGATQPRTIPSPDQQSDFEVHQERKRMKLEVPNTKVSNPSSLSQGDGQHCRVLFQDSFKGTFTADEFEVSNTEVPKPSSSLSQGDGQNGQEILNRTKQGFHFLFDNQVNGNQQETTTNNFFESNMVSSDSSDESDGNSVSSEEANSDSSSAEGDETSSDESDCLIESSEEEDNISDDETGVFISPRVYEGCTISQDECVLNLMNLFIKSKMTKTQMGGVLKCMLQLIPPSSNLPKTEYSLFNYVKKLSPVSEEKVKIHFYCSECLFYLGPNEISCTLCSGESHKFYQIPLADQIKNLFEQHGLADIIDKYNEDRKSCNVDDSYCDLLDGSAFKKAQLDGPYNLTLMGHTDGISISDSSDASLWPLEWVAAEIPPRLRFKYVFISGICIDKVKPYMNSMLKPFVGELRTIYEEGVQWVHPRTKQVYTTRVTVPSFCVDAPVRAQLQNILQHGGKHCCHACEQKMKKLPPEPVVPGKKKKRGSTQSVHISRSASNTKNS